MTPSITNAVTCPARKQFFIPTKPFTLTDQINRVAAATGSVRYAMGAAYADYNGHRITVDFNDYRGYYIAQYYWGERVVIARGDFAQVLDAGIKKFDRSGKGACLIVIPKNEDVHLCESNARLMAWSKEVEESEMVKWYTWKHSAVAHAMTLERQYAIPMQLLMEAETKEAWDAAVTDAFKARHAYTK